MQFLRLVLACLCNVPQPRLLRPTILLKNPWHLQLLVTIRFKIQRLLVLPSRRFLCIFARPRQKPRKPESPQTEWPTVFPSCAIKFLPLRMSAWISWRTIALISLRSKFCARFPTSGRLWPTSTKPTCSN